MKKKIKTSPCHEEEGKAKPLPKGRRGDNKGGLTRSYARGGRGTKLRFHLKSAKKFWLGNWTNLEGKTRSSGKIIDTGSSERRGEN